MPGLADCRTDRKFSGRSWLALVPVVLACPAVSHAQVAANFALSSNAVFRGETISADDPAATGSVSFDHASGLFGGASITVAAGGRNPRVAATSQYAGFALRSGTTSLEGGAIHRRYGVIADEAYSRDYFEGFVGISRRNLKARIYISPDYLIDARTTYYGEIEARLFHHGPWSLNGRGGLYLIPPDIGAPGRMRQYYDWGLSVTRPVGKFGTTLGVVGSNYPVFSVSRGTGLFSNSPKFYVSVARSF